LKVALLNEIKQSGDEPRGEGVYMVAGRDTCKMGHVVKLC
jgi:hypothetical protein